MGRKSKKVAAAKGGHKQPQAAQKSGPHQGAKDAAPLKALVAQKYLPYFRQTQKGDTMVVSGFEPGVMVDGAAAGMVQTVGLVAPLNSLLFPRLSGIAGAFQRFRFMKLRLVYQALCATSTAGYVTGAFVDDPLAPAAADPKQLLIYKGSIMSPVWSSADGSADLPRDAEWYYVSGSFDVDVVKYIQGQVQLIWEGMTSATRGGIMFIEYVCELRDPRPTVTSSLWVETGAQDITNSAPAVAWTDVMEQGGTWAMELASIVTPISTWAQDTIIPIILGDYDEENAVFPLLMLAMESFWSEPASDEAGSNGWGEEEPQVVRSVAPPPRWKSVALRRARGPTGHHVYQVELNGGPATRRELEEWLTARETHALATKARLPKLVPRPGLGVDMVSCSHDDFVAAGGDLIVPMAADDCLTAFGGYDMAGNTIDTSFAITTNLPSGGYQRYAYEWTPTEADALVRVGRLKGQTAAGQTSTAAFSFALCRQNKTGYNETDAGLANSAARIGKRPWGTQGAVGAGPAAASRRVSRPQYNSIQVRGS